MDILEVYAELLAAGLDEEEAARLTTESIEQHYQQEAGMLGVVVAVIGVLLCITLTIGGL